MPADVSVWRAGFQEKVGLPLIMCNAVIAFSLNLATVQLINETGAVTYILCGIMKDVLIVSGSVFFLGTAIQPQQIMGYCLALSGIFIFQQAKSKTEEFRLMDLLSEMHRLAMPTAVVRYSKVPSSDVEEMQEVDDSGMDR